MHKHPLTRTWTAAVLGAALILAGCSSGPGGQPSGAQPTPQSPPPTAAPKTDAVINIARGVLRLRQEGGHNVRVALRFLQLNKVGRLRKAYHASARAEA